MIATPTSRPIEACTHKNAMRGFEWLVQRSTYQQGIGPYLTKLIQDAHEHQNGPAGVAHPEEPKLVVTVVEHLLLQFVACRLVGRFKLCIGSMSAPRDESAEREADDDDDQGADCKEPQRQVLP